MTADPFAALPSALEEKMETALMNGHQKNGAAPAGAKALIGQPSQTTIVERVEAAFEALGLDLHREMTVEVKQAVAQHACCTPAQVKSAVERMRTQRNIRTKPRGRTAPAATPRPLLGLDPASVSEDGPQPNGPKNLARHLALELASELLVLAQSRDGNPAERPALLLAAAQLVRKVL